MSILSRLTSIVSIKNSLPKLKNVAINFFSNNNSKKITYQDNRVINININKLSPEDIPIIKEIKDQILTQTNPLIENNTQALLEDFTKADKENHELINSFKGKIPPTDLEILRASLFVKKLHDNHKELGNLKLDIKNRYGDRGLRICNLTTAGYFTSLIKPLYEELFSRKEFQPIQFFSIYETIVTQSLYALFVNSRMTDSEVKNMVQEKIELSKKYGINYLNIHGIGRENVDKIINILAELRESFKTPPRFHESTPTIIIVTIYF